MHDADALLAIGAMAILTYATRAGGFLVMSMVPLSPRLEAFLRHLSGSVLVAIIFPAAVTSGPAAILAILAAVLVMHRTRNALFAMTAGIGLAALLRAWF
ncbi:MAG: AzlD domain-containing protein [Geminicoccaceae bacterium]